MFTCSGLNIYLLQGKTVEVVLVLMYAWHCVVRCLLSIELHWDYYCF